MLTNAITVPLFTVTNKNWGRRVINKIRGGRTILGEKEKSWKEEKNCGFEI